MAENDAEKLIYVSIPEFTKTEMQRAITEDDIEKLIYVPLFASLYYEDRDFAEEVCIKLANHSNEYIRGNSIEGFEHIARTDGKLNREVVKPIIEKGIKDESDFVRDKSEWTRDATKQFLKWKYEMLKSSVVYDEDPKKQLKKEEKRATKLLKGRIIKKISRNRKEEVVIDFKDGTRFSIDWREHEKELDLSITGNFEEDE